jgi:hypothetical protein
MDVLSSATLNDGESPLLRLPGEIRNRIYTYVIKFRPYEFAIVKPDSTGRRARLKHRANGVQLSRVCRRLYHETAMLPFSLNEFCCANFYVCEVLHKLFTTTQRAAMRKLIVKVAGDKFWPTRMYLHTVIQSGFALSQHYPNLDRVVVRSYYTVDNPGGRVRGIIEGKRTLLTEWFTKGEKEGFEVEFQDLNRVEDGKSAEPLGLDYLFSLLGEI